MEAIINELYNLVLARRNNGEDKSYTKYLLDKGEDKILKKFGEEAIEVIIACKVENKQDQVEEICDLIYHMIVLMVSKNIKLENIEQELTIRRDKINNFKGERKEILEI